MKQICGRIWLGRLKVMFSRIGLYFSYINFIILVMTFYSVTGYRYAPLWMFLLASGIGAVCIGGIDYFVMLPSEQAFLNQQFARHKNPLCDDIKYIKQKLEEVK